MWKRVYTDSAIRRNPSRAGHSSFRMNASYHDPILKGCASCVRIVRRKSEVYGGSQPNTQTRAQDGVEVSVVQPGQYGCNRDAWADALPRLRIHDTTEGRSTPTPIVAVFPRQQFDFLRPAVGKSAAAFSFSCGSKRRFRRSMKPATNSSQSRLAWAALLF